MYPPWNHMLAVVETLFFHPKNVGVLNSKLGWVADTNPAINWLQPYFLLNNVRVSK